MLFEAARNQCLNVGPGFERNACLIFGTSRVRRADLRRSSSSLHITSSNSLIRNLGDLALLLVPSLILLKDSVSLDALYRWTRCIAVSDQVTYFRCVDNETADLVF